MSKTSLTVLTLSGANKPILVRRARMRSQSAAKSWLKTGPALDGSRVLLSFHNCLALSALHREKLDLSIAHGPLVFFAHWMIFVNEGRAYV